jgi:hypothetical protein
MMITKCPQQRGVTAITWQPLWRDLEEEAKCRRSLIER